LTDDVRLNIESLVTGYKGLKVLSGVSLRVLNRQIVAVIGHNGAGKSTLLKATFGLLAPWEGSIRFEGKDLAAMKPKDLRQSGIAYVPQGNRVFSSLSVLDNLLLSSCAVRDGRRRDESFEHVLTIFPQLKPLLKRRAGTLSGGEKQMLALGGALVVSPRLLLLDEPSLGLSPPLVIEVLQQVERIRNESGASIIIVEQKVRQVLDISDFVYVFRNGVVQYSGTAKSLRDDSHLAEFYL
jgi:ABC-type branched-subunit amino acid transport system ATPase component